MQYVESITIRSRRLMTIGEFLETSDLVRRQAGDLKPLDWLAGQFLPDADKEEAFDDWIARNAAAILQTALLRDDMGSSGHITRKISSVDISPGEKAWLFHALGRHPEVRRIWRSMAMEAIAA